jgi:hypothetical protein
MIQAGDLTIRRDAENGLLKGTRLGQVSKRRVRPTHLFFWLQRSDVGALSLLFLISYPTTKEPKPPFTNRSWTSSKANSVTNSSN